MGRKLFHTDDVPPTQVQVALEQVLWSSSYLNELSVHVHCMGLAESI